VYIPKHFEEPRIHVMHDLIRAYPLSTVVTGTSSGLNANHIPLHLSESSEPYGVLRGHVARANPLLDDIRNEAEALAIFHGPNAYITPSWYATKKETGKVVPTWNYSAVHAYGVFRIIEEASWVRDQLNSLTTENESDFPEPWSISDAPPDYIDQIMKAIVGVEMVITKLLGKWKVSQNQPSQNQASVIAGLKESGSSTALAMAALVETGAKDAR
jgi:transcriptional regulator